MLRRSKQVLDQDANAEMTSQLIEDWDGSLKDVELLSVAWGRSEGQSRTW